MAVKIRLKRMGKIRAPYYRIVVADARTKRDGRVIEEIGKYHPKADPSFIEVDSDRAQYWLGVGAQPSEPVAAILKVTGDWQRFRGEAAPPPMLVAEPKRDKTDIFNEALKDSASEPKTEAVTAKKAASKKTAPVESAAPSTEEASPALPAAAIEPGQPGVEADASAADVEAVTADPSAADEPASPTPSPTANGEVGASEEPTAPVSVEETPDVVEVVASEEPAAPASVEATPGSDEESADHTPADGTATGDDKTEA